MKRFLKKLSGREIGRRGGFILPSFSLNQKEERPISFHRTLFLLTLCLALSACGGGSGSESGSEPAVTEEVATGSQSISFLEKIPNSTVANANLCAIQEKVDTETMAKQKQLQRNVRLEMVATSCVQQ